LLRDRSALDVAKIALKLRTDCYKCKTEKPDENRQRSGSHSGGRMQQHDDEEDLNMQGNIDKVEIDA